MHNSMLNSLAKYITPRNVGHYFGFNAIQAMVGILWYRQRKSGDATALLIEHFMQEEAVAVDIGASWGLFSYYFARRVKKDGLVFAYEPHPANKEVLQKLSNARPNFRFRPVAISDKAGTADMYVPVQGDRQVTAQSSIAHDFSTIKGVRIERIKVPTVRLDDELGPDIRVDFVKIDVEGHEISVLRGARRTLQRSLPPVLIEIEQRHLDIPIHDVFRELQEIGYQVFFIEASAIHPIDQFDLDKHQLWAVKENEFTPFGMPAGYVYNFCAVRSTDSLKGLPGFP